MSDGDDLTHRALAVPTRRRLFELLERAPAARSVAELARDLGVHENTVRLHLDVLGAAGLVRASAPGAHLDAGRGRPPSRYAAVGVDPSDEALAYQRLASRLAGVVAPEGAFELGRRVGVAAASAGDDGGLDGVEALLRLLRDEGFAPALGATGDVVVLRRCPFGAVAALAPATVCALHDGMVRGFAEAAGGWDAHLVVGEAPNPACGVRLTRGR